MKLRTILAIGLSPMAGGILLTACMNLPDLGAYDLFELNTFNAVSGATQSAFLMSYFCAVLLGSPVYLGLHYLRQNSIIAYAIAGLCLGFIAYVFYYRAMYAVYDGSREDGYTQPFWHDELWLGTLAMCTNFITYWLIARPQETSHASVTPKLTESQNANHFPLSSFATGAILEPSTTVAVVLSPLAGTIILTTYTYLLHLAEITPIALALWFFFAAYFIFLPLLSLGYVGLSFFHKRSARAYGILGLCAGFIISGAYVFYYRGNFPHGVAYKPFLPFSGDVEIVSSIILSGLANAMSYWLIARPQMRLS